MEDDIHIGAHRGLSLANVRAALAIEVERCRTKAWDSLHAEGGPREVSLEWLSDHVGRLMELDRGLALIESRGEGRAAMRRASA